LEIWWLKPIGGAYLLYMAFSHFAKGSKEEIKEEVAETKKSKLYRSTIGIFGVFWSTVIAVEFMDIVFSIDNIFAVVAYTPNLFIICTGVFIGILAMRYVAKYFVVLMEKYPFLEKSAFLVIGILGLKLCFAMVVHFFPSYEWIESEEFDLFVSALTLLIFIIPIVSVRFFKKKK
jgi:YkoY family integral membrane protein